MTNLTDRRRNATDAMWMQAKREAFVWVRAIPILLVIWVVWPGLETRVWPVITEIDILSAEDAGGGWTKMEVEADKLRDCDWRAIEWFVGQRGHRNAQVQANFLDAPEVRSIGRLHWDGLMIRLPLDVILTNSFGNVYHECYGENLGRTKSFYYTSPGYVMEDRLNAPDVD